MNSAVIILAVIFGFVIVKHFLDAHREARLERLRLIEKTIHSGQLDRDQLELLTAELSGKRRRRSFHFGAVILALGWIGMFVGGGMAAAGAIMDMNEPIIAGVVVGLISFGVTTYPFALRELEARRST